MEEKPNNVNVTKKTRQRRDFYEVPPTKRTPEVRFDLYRGILKITGASKPYDVNEFYFPIMRKIDHYLSRPHHTTYLIFHLESIDFSSSQFILAIIYRMKKVFDLDRNLQVEWYYKKNNMDMLEVGETYAELSGLDFIFHVIEGGH